jgi:hypothetical protein
MDAWWPRLAHAMFDGGSGGAIDALGIGLRPAATPPWVSVQRRFYGQVEKDLRQVLGSR